MRQRLYDTHQLAKTHILEQKHANKRTYDKKINPIELKKNDLVLIKKEVKSGKFDEPYEGPFRVVDVPSEVTVFYKRGKKIARIHKYRVKKATADYGDKTPPEIQ